MERCDVLQCGCVEPGAGVGTVRVSCARGWMEVVWIGAQSNGCMALLGVSAGVDTFIATRGKG